MSNEVLVAGLTYCALYLGVIICTLILGALLQGEIRCVRIRSRLRRELYKHGQFRDEKIFDL
jgi:hypothetical protein